MNSVWDSKWTSIHEYLHKGKKTDIDRVLNLFSLDRKLAMERFIAYMEEDNEDQCLDLTTTVKLSDDQVREYLRTAGVTSNSMLQQMNKEKRDEILTQVKKLKGVSIRQISRVTGISKSVIGRN
ncbi:hypothetical protein J2S74_000192 [Evansella vedderi]|uniref:Uncharacterized protein n=1 Tax=Evansella vedderi TaxID=38282 RepID=A0ABT9ZRM6_9BACI|nr:hypothetical protein [Evansella vedderi]MDQ0252820.1 hypothetical protein [Evansella vedderi]